MQALFDAADITGLSTNVSTILISMIGITLLFVGYNFVRRSVNKG
jgi:hypothetical protein